MTQPLSFDASGVQFAWDQTSLGHASNCLRKYQLVMLEGWRPKHTSDHLTFGVVYATALEHYHKYRAAGMGYDEAVNEVVREALIATWEYEPCSSCGGNYFDPGPEPFDQTTAAVCPDCYFGKKPGTGQPWKSLHNTKTRENLIRTIVWYLDQFQDDPCKTVILSDGRAAVEHSFALPVDNGIILTGHLDRLVDYGDKIYIQDQKTTGTTISPRYFAQYQNDNQMYQYTFAGKAIFGLPIKGVMVDAAQIAVGFTRFERGFVFLGDDQLNEWYDNTMWHIEQAQHATREGYFPMNRTSCNDYGGCPFRDVCSKTPAIREQFLKAEFEKGKRWDPLETR